MSTFYKKNNFEGSKLLFSKSRIYKTRMRRYATSDSAVVDFNLAEKFLYGRVNRNFVPMIPIPDVGNRGSKNFKNFNKKSAGAPVATFKALNFVVDAFNDLQQQFRKCALKGLIDSNDPYLSDLAVYKAYVDPIAAYKKYSTGYFAGLRDAFKIRNTEIMDFAQFSDHLKILVEKTAKTTPFTFPAFVKSRRCPINVSGLVVEIANFDASNDEEKIRTFINSPNWEFYLNACRTHGFMVDMTCPWRLVADIGSSAMLKYSAKYGPTGTTSIITSKYVPAHVGYYGENGFMQDILTLYNSCVPKKKVETEYCNGSIIVREKKPAQYSSVVEIRRAASSNVDIMMDLYFDIRFMEEETVYDNAQKRSLKKDCFARQSQGGIKKYQNVQGSPQKSISGFERIINKPFDYRGSLTYNNNIHIPAAEKDFYMSLNNKIIVGDSSGGSSGGGY